MNTRFVLISSGLMLALAIGMHGVHAMQVGRNATHLKDRAEAAEAEGKYTEAAQLFGQYLTFREEDLEARLHLLRLRDGLATNARTLHNVMLGYEEVLRRDPHRADEAEIRQDIVAVAMGIEQYSIALFHLKTLLDEESYQAFREKDSGQTAELHYQRGYCHQAEGRTPEAWKCFLDALALRSDEYKYYLPVAVLFAEQHQNLPRREKSGLTDEETLPVDEKIQTLLPVKNQGRFEPQKSADTILAWMIQEAKNPAGAFLARAQVRSRQGDLAKSREDVEQSRTLDPQNRDMLLFSAELAAKQAQDARYRGNASSFTRFLTQARQDVKEGLAHHPEAAGFHLLRSVIESEAREGLRLLPAVAEKRGANPQYPERLRTSAQQLQWAYYENEEVVLQEGLAAIQQSLKDLNTQKPQRTRLRMQDPNRSLGLYQLVQIGNQLRWSFADNLISKHLLLHSDPLHQAAPSASLESLKTAVNEQIETLKKSGEALGKLMYLEARLLVAEGDWKEAAWTLEQTRRSLAGQKAIIHRIDLLLDQCYEHLGNPYQQLQVALTALKETPNWLPALVRLPLIYQRANRTDDSLKAYERIQELPGASLAIARLRLQKELNKPVESRRWDAIYQALDAARANGFEDSAAVAILWADVLSLEAAQMAERGDEAKSEEKSRLAVAELDNALDRSPKNAELQAARGLLELKLPWPKTRTTGERIQGAAAIVEKALLNLGDSLPLRLAAVQIASLLPTPDALSELSALEKPAFPANEQPDFLEGLARGYAIVSSRAAGQEEKDPAFKLAQEYLKQAAALRSQEIGPQISLAEQAVNQKDAATIQTAIERVQKIEGPAGAIGNYLKSLRILVDLKREDAENIALARKFLTQAMIDRPFWAALPRTMADLEWLVGNQEIAITHYEAAFKLGDRTRAMVVRMVDYYYTHQKVDYADEFLRSIALDSPILLSGELARWKWRVDWQMQRYQEAVGLASDYASRSNDYTDHLWESRLRFTRGERGAAVLSPLLKARDLAKDKPEPWLALVGYYVRTGDLTEAKATIEEAKKEENLAADPPHQRLVTLARCYDLLNDRDEAEKSYQAALKVAKDESNEVKVTLQLVLADFYSRSRDSDPQQQQSSLDKADQILDELLDPREDVPQSARDWARYRRALIAAASGRYDDTERALELLAKGRAGGEVAEEDLRTEMRILRIRNRFQDRLALIKVLETLDTRKVLTVDDRFLLARTYENTNQWPKAQIQFQQLLKDVGKETQPARGNLVANYALALFSQKDLDKTIQLPQGELLVKELERLEPGTFRTRATRAMLLYRQGREKEAADTLLEYMARFDQQTPEQAFRDLIEQREINEALDAFQTQLDEKSAKQIIDQVRRLVVEGNQEEAVSSLKQHIAARDLAATVQTSLVRVIARFLEELEQYSAAEEAYGEFAERSKRPEAILEVAAFLARRNRIDEALNICDSAWKNCDPRFVATVSVGTLRTGGKPTSGQIQRVEAHLTAAVENASPEHWTQLITTFADLRDLQGRHADSITIYREMLKRNPQNATALNNLAWLLSYQSQSQAEAQKLIDQAIRLYGPIGALLDTRGMISLRRGQASKALKDLKHAAEELLQAPIYFHLAQAYLAMGDKPAAEAAFRDAQAKNLDPIKDLHVLEAEEYQRIVEMFP